MDILDILKNSGKELYSEDLDFFETELATGGKYDAAYQAQCRSIIKRMRFWMRTGEEETVTEACDQERMGTPAALMVDVDKLAPESSNPLMKDRTPDEILFQRISRLRESSSYKSEFKKYIKEQDIVDGAFVEKNYAFFDDWELNAILSVKQFEEPFLEKYFGALDHDKIARYQLFSEAFFMRHFAQMDYTVVLQHGKNEWRRKENRSKQLDVFLRLKGVKI